MNIDSQQECDRPSATSFKNQQQVPRRRSVSFSLNSTICYYRIPKDDPQEFYSDEDQERMKADARKDLAAFRRIKTREEYGCGSSDDDPEERRRNLCIVGLEQHLVSPEFSRERARTKKLVTRAVLVEQARPYYSVDDDKVERIAEAARRYSEWSAARAKMFGDFQYIQSKECRWLLNTTHNCFGVIYIIVDEAV